MAHIKDITAMGDGIFTVVFEKDGEREVTIFKDRATQQDLDSLEVYHPAPDDQIVSLKVSNDILEDMKRWAEKRGVTTEQVWQAILIYLAKHRQKRTASGMGMWCCVGSGNDNEVKKSVEVRGRTPLQEQKDMRLS